MHYLPSSDSADRLTRKRKSLRLQSTQNQSTTLSICLLLIGYPGLKVFQRCGNNNTSYLVASCEPCVSFLKIAISPSAEELCHIPAIIYNLQSTIYLTIRSELFHNRCLNLVYLLVFVICNFVIRFASCSSHALLPRNPQPWHCEE